MLENERNTSAGVNRRLKSSLFHLPSLSYNIKKKRVQMLFRHWPLNKMRGGGHFHLG